MSSASSHPTERRRSPGETPAAASWSGEYWRWLVEAGWCEHRVDAAEARRAPAELERVHEPLAGLAAAGELEGEHAAGVAELAQGELVLRVALEAGVENLRDLRVALEEPRRPPAR